MSWFQTFSFRIRSPPYKRRMAEKEETSPAPFTTTKRGPCMRRATACKIATRGRGEETSPASSTGKSETKLPDAFSPCYCMRNFDKGRRGENFPRLLDREVGNEALEKRSATIIHAEFRSGERRR